MRIAICLVASCATVMANCGAEQPPSDLSEVARQTLSLLSLGRYAEAAERFSPTLREALPAAKLHAVWSGLEEQFGALVDSGILGVESSGGGTTVMVECSMARGKLRARVIFSPGQEIAGLWISPAEEPAVDEASPCEDSDSYSESAVLVQSGGVSLPGILTMPVAPGPVPGVVLVAGSGPADKDLTIGPNRPFKHIAHGLASRGIAVLRYDKRTFVKAAVAEIMELTVMEESVYDAIAAVKLLRGNDRIDPGRIFILGHSYGGTLIPRMAPLDEQVAGFIIMAGLMRPLEDAFVEQLKYLASLDESITGDEETKIQNAQRQVQAIKNLKPPFPETAIPLLLLGAPAGYWYDLRNYDPWQAARQIARPVLVLQGEQDYQVTMEDFERWKKAFAGQQDKTFLSYAGLNHLFMEHEGRSQPMEYLEPGIVSCKVLQDIADWIARIQPPH